MTPQRTDKSAEMLATDLYREACAIMLHNGITPAEVEAYDVLQIQNDNEWVQIGAASCE